MQKHMPMMTTIVSNNRIAPTAANITTELLTALLTTAIKGKFKKLLKIGKKTVFNLSII